MNIYIIKVNTKITYDCYDSHVIVANTPKEVVELAQKVSADEGMDAWEENYVRSIGQYEGDLTTPHIIISSFNAG